MSKVRDQVRLSFGNEGWVGVDFGSKRQVLVRVHPDAKGRLRIEEFYFGGGGPIQAGDLRVRLGWIENYINLPDSRRAVMSRLEIPGIDMRSLADSFARTTQSQVSTRRQKAARSALEGQIRRRPRVRKPRNGHYPGSFYLTVTKAYRAALRDGRPPTPFIAEEASVRLTTAAYWIKEARRRGYLGSALQGRAGEAGELELRYIGPHDEVEVPLPDGRTLLVRREASSNVPIDYALGLLEQETNWIPVGRERKGARR